MLHSWTGSPQEVRGLGEHLAAQGHTVLGPRLTHHGTTPGDMNRSRWRDWYFCALDGWYVLKAQCEEVTAVGLSMGGTLALGLASQQPLSAVATLSTPIDIPADWRLRFAEMLAFLHPFYPKSEQTASWADEGAAALRVAYSVWPARAVREARDGLREMRDILPRINVPVLLMHSRDDLVVPSKHMDRIYERLGSIHKEKVLLERGDHVITEDADREFVFTRVAKFISTHTQ